MNDTDVLSILTPDEVHSLGGLPPDAVAGTLSGDDRTVDGFRPNPRFVALMHEVIRTAASSDPGLSAAARAQGDGWVYVIDLRTPEGPQGNIPPEDIIGAFEVRQGELVPDSYRANDGHRVFTENGLVTLPPSLRAALVERLADGRS